MERVIQRVMGNKMVIIAVIIPMQLYVFIVLMMVMMAGSCWVSRYRWDGLVDDYIVVVEHSTDRLASESSHYIQYYCVWNNKYLKLSSHRQSTC